MRGMSTAEKFCKLEKKKDQALVIVFLYSFLPCPLTKQCKKILTLSGVPQGADIEDRDRVAETERGR